MVSTLELVICVSMLAAITVISSHVAMTVNSANALNLAYTADAYIAFAFFSLAFVMAAKFAQDLIELFQFRVASGVLIKAYYMHTMRDATKAADTTQVAQTEVAQADTTQVAQADTASNQAKDEMDTASNNSAELSGASTE
jgi:hypothetical protein